MPTLTAAAYLRVSTEWQATRGEGLEDQRSAITAWAKAEGVRIASWHCDEGESGARTLEHRVGLASALEEITHHRASVLVVFKLDRLARDLVLQEQLLAEVWRAGGIVRSTSRAESAYLDPDPGDPSRRLIRQVLGAVAEYERNMIRLRLELGRARKMAAGGYGGGNVPYGWTNVGGTLEPNPDEQATLARMRELRASGLSLRQVDATLRAEGRMPRNAASWTPKVVATLTAQP